MEAMIVLATLLGQYRIELVPGAPVVPEPSVTLRPQGPLMMRLRARHALPLAAE
jgi:cytochrome P450